jgi:lipoic acid synthetase
MKASLRKSGLHTVCEEAKCPNICECFAKKTATFMIMGNVCTRNCRFCAVKTGTPSTIDEGEPQRIANEVKRLELVHAVVTSVTRDDLPDGGATHFAKTISAIQTYVPNATVEVLTPDFDGMESCIKTVCEAHPEVFNHNIETVERITASIRSRAEYRRSLGVLELARKLLPDGFIKSGIMVGLGETDEEIFQTLKDLKQAGCEIVTIGQYLRPNMSCVEIDRFVAPEVFCKYEGYGKEIGLKHLFAGPFVRSSYMASEALQSASK